MKVFELIDLLKDVEDKNKDIYIQCQGDNGNFTSYLRVKEYVDGVIIWEKSK